jgi:Amt family ammonium transporter
MPLRGSDQEEAIGMDIIHHGEEAYASGEGAILIRTSPPADKDVRVAEPV